MNDEQKTKEQLLNELSLLQKHINEKGGGKTSPVQPEDGVKRRLEFEKTVSAISSRFIGHFNLSSAIQESLSEMGRLRKANRAYIYFVSKDGKMMDLFDEWKADGESQLEETVKNFPVNMFPAWMEKLKRGEYVHIKSASRMPRESKSEKDLLDSYGIKSILMYPLFLDRSFSGFIGFDSNERTLEWIEEDVEMLRVASEILGTAIKFNYQEEELEEYRSHLEKLVEERTIELRKLNEKLVEEIAERKKVQAERERYIEELQEAFAKIKTLRGLLPICAHCKKIRDDKGYWQNVEAYVKAHTDAEFSHSLCPDCIRTLYPELEM